MNSDFFNPGLFHFAEPAWLWALIAIPALALIHALFGAQKNAAALLERFADRHILPHILGRPGRSGRSLRLPLFFWSLAWLCAVLAMAGPRWSYTDTPIFKKTQDIVLVLDLSQSMSAADVKPSRAARALQEISDIMAASPGTSIGLIAYAAVPHMVTPLTDDFRTLRALLPALDTSLVTVQGDRLEPALQMATRLLQAEPGNSKAIIVLSDGEYTDSNDAQLVTAAGGNPIYTIGIGTKAGTPIVGPDGQWQTDRQGKVIVSHLRTERLQMLASAGHGAYAEGDYGNGDTGAILARIGVENTRAQQGQLTLRVWSERFYIPAAVLMALLLPLFRRGMVFPAVLALLGMAHVTEARAATLTDVFLNSQQQARAAFEHGDYKAALAGFDTPYRRGVALYRAGDYENAAYQFKIAADENNTDALYNLGNAQLMLRLPQNAIGSYEAVLKRRPNDAPAKRNLEIARKMLKFSDLQPPTPPDNQNNNQNKNNQNNQNQNQNGGGGQNKNPDKNNPDKQQNQSNNPKDDSKQKDAGNAPPKGQQDRKPGQQPPQKPQQNPPPQSQPQQESPQSQAQQPRQQQPQQQQPQQQPPPPQQQAQQPPQQQAQRPPQQQGPQSAARGAAQPAAPGQGGDALSQKAADAWLGHIQNDPAGLLRNQFRIEDQAGSRKPEAAP